MQRLTLEILAQIIGEGAAEKLLNSHPQLFSMSPAGNKLEPVSFSAIKPWRGETLTLHLPEGSVTFKVADDIQPQAIDAVIHAELEGLPLGVRVDEGEIVEIWVVE